MSPTNYYKQDMKRIGIIEHVHCSQFEWTHNSGVPFGSQNYTNKFGL